MPDFPSNPPLFHHHPGRTPVIINVPHAGTLVPPEIEARFSDAALPLPDTDWHVGQLYHFAREMGVHFLMATHSRYVVDLNRAPDDASLYPGKFTTGLCPTTLFDGTPIYKEDKAPDAAEIASRKEVYWQPYHARLQSLINAVKVEHGYVILFDAHSIRATVPNLFDGQLPDLNLGTADGKSCNEKIAETLFTIAQESPYSAVLNGRFKGGYITRHYGQPEAKTHAIQLELAQRNYMGEEVPYPYLHDKAEQLQHTLKKMMDALLAWRPNAAESAPPPRG